jgi:hypothetical protein
VLLAERNVILEGPPGVGKKLPAKKSVTQFLPDISANNCSLNCEIGRKRFCPGEENGFDGGGVFQLRQNVSFA